jgi:hypothetical protein
MKHIPKKVTIPSGIIDQFITEWEELTQKKYWGAQIREKYNESLKYLKPYEKLNAIILFKQLAKVADKNQKQLKSPQHFALIASHFSSHYSDKIAKKGGLVEEIKESWRESDLLSVQLAKDLPYYFLFLIIALFIALLFGLI